MPILNFQLQGRYEVLTREKQDALTQKRRNTRILPRRELALTSREPLEHGRLHHLSSINTIEIKHLDCHPKNLDQELLCEVIKNDDLRLNSFRLSRDQVLNHHTGTHSHPRIYGHLIGKSTRISLKV